MNVSIPSGKRGLTDITGVKVGHHTHRRAGTGCTAILFEGGATAGAHISGFASGTREFSPLHPLHLVPQIHGLMLAGGSAFGLAAASGAMRFLEERGVGLPVGPARIPIVPSAIIFDLAVRSSSIHPDAEMGYQACRRAGPGKVAEGSVGAGTGASVGKVLGVAHAMKGGLGSASLIYPDGLTVAALAVVNAFGDVIDPEKGRIIAGARSLDGRGFLDTQRFIIEAGANPRLPHSGGSSRLNTTLGVVGTNATLDRSEVGRTARIAAGALPRCLRPSGSHFDGDLVVAFATGAMKGDPLRIGIMSALALERAVLRGVTEAKGFRGLPGIGQE